MVGATPTTKNASGATFRAAKQQHGNRINGFSSKLLLESDFLFMKTLPSSLQT